MDFYISNRMYLLLQVSGSRLATEGIQRSTVREVQYFLVHGCAITRNFKWRSNQPIISIYFRQIPFFYFVLRNDAVDVVYGTKAGVESLDIPYMAHVEPPSRWGE